MKTLQKISPNFWNFALIFALFAPQVLGHFAHAERADRRKPMVVDSGEYDGDNKAKILQLRKGVTITQGTLKIIGDRGEVKGEPPTSVAKLFGAPVCFRQKKDGSDEVMRGQGDRIEYDQNRERVEFFGKVVVHDGANEMRAEHIVYNMRSETFEVRDKPNTQARVVLVPREKEEPESATSDATKDAVKEVVVAKDTPKPKLKTSKEIEAGRYEPLASKCIKEAL
jgi:lipopolysaccharide export system protein LptA